MSRRQQRGDGCSRLLRLAGQPETFATLSLADWDLIVRQAMRAGILARLCFQLAELDALNKIPERPRSRLEAAKVLALKHQRDVRWELACVRSALARSGIPITLLKGAAYLMAELPSARGRLFSDVDFMVPRDRIDEVERALVDGGWEPSVTNAYDQYYYRRWTHQIPPLRHFRRNTVLDVHHTIVPLTARSPVAADTLTSECLSLRGDGQLRILAPPDMVLHAAVHLFNEGEYDHGLRDLLDISDLLQHFGRLPHFWDDLATRAEALGLTGPLYLALRYLDRLLRIPLQNEMRAATGRWRPAAPKRALLDALLLRALLPDHDSCNHSLAPAARWLLYVRAHYIRMPLHLLLPHLARKGLFRPADRGGSSNRRDLQLRIEELLRLGPPVHHAGGTATENSSE